MNPETSLDPNLLATNFQTLDWVIVAVYLLASMVIGVVANRYIASLSDYLVAGRSLRVWLAVATMTGTELGLVTVVYSAELGYKYQFAPLVLGLIELGAMLAIGLTGLIVYRLRQTGVMTIPEYYEQRYSAAVRVIGGVILVLAGILNMGLFLKAGSRFLTGLTGLPEGGWLKAVMTGLLVLVLVYTVLGGMISVVLTDFLQFLVLGTAAVLVSILVVWNVGWATLFTQAPELRYEAALRQAADQEEADSVDPVRAKRSAVDPTVADGEFGGPMYLLYQAVVIFIASLLWPVAAQRTLSAKTPRVAKQVFAYSSVAFMARRVLPMLWGLGAFVYFAQSIELTEALDAAIASGDLSTQSAMPLFLAKILPTGLIGLVAAGLIAAFMSTHDSYLLCWSSVFTQDIVAPLCGPISQRGRIWITRCAIVVIGAFLLIWGLWYESDQDLWNYMSITGSIYFIGAFPVILGGLYWPRANSYGAMASLASGLLAVLALDPLLAPLKKILGWEWLQPQHVVLATFVVAGAAMIAVSLLTPPPKTRED